METTFEIKGIVLPQIRAFRTLDEIMILHKGNDSLLAFTVFDMPEDYVVAKAVNDSMGLSGLDWSQDFDVVFHRKDYRAAVLKVADILLS